jgi:adenosylcobinamide-GDP ribazoletransferase
LKNKQQILVKTEKMKREWNIFLTAIMFFTRIPVPKKLPFSEELLNSSSKYLPVIGWIVGGLTAFSFYGFNQLLPVSVSILLSMGFSILLTGGFHEDGFSDVCDGFGGGYSKLKILEIMKDSRIGVYGGTGLILILITKFFAIYELEINLIALMLILAHTTSRFAPVLFMFTYEYVREDSTSKVKPVGKKINTTEFIFAGITMLAPFIFLFTSNLLYLFAIGAVIIFTFVFSNYCYRKIGGYTGDCLGAVQQITETGFYIVVLILSGFL